MSFLKNHTFRVDFKKGKLQFINNLGTNPGSPVDLTCDIPNLATPFVNIKLSEKQSSSFMLDTGANVGLCLNQVNFDTLVNDNLLQVTGTTAYKTESGNQTYRKGVVNRIVIHRNTIENIPVLCLQGSEQICGLKIMSIYICTFDFKNNSLSGRKQVTDQAR